MEATPRARRRAARASTACLVLAAMLAAAGPARALAQSEPLPAPQSEPRPAPSATTAATAATDQPDEALEAPATLRVARPATVNGQSITSEDIANQARLLREERGDLPLEDLLRLARRQIAEQILMAGEAERRGVTLPDRELDDYWERRGGSVPDYAALAEETGTSVERQKTLARRAALAELYLLHRIGVRMDLARQIPPEPLLVRLVTITPAQLRDAFATNRALLDMPAHVTLDVYPCPDLAAGESICAALAAGERPPGPPPLDRVVPMPGLAERYMPEMVEYLSTSAPGSCRVDVGPDGGAVLVIRSHEPARPARFEAVQERLRQMLQRELIGEARQHLVASLAEEASCWPRDLLVP
jgi:hypothetical protein